MRRAHDPFVFRRPVDRQIQGFHRPGIGGDRHDHQRKQDAHPENRDHHSPGQEPPLPDRRHGAQLGRVDDGIVEGQRYFEDHQHRADDHEGKTFGHGPLDRPAKPKGNGQPQHAQADRPAEIMHDVLHLGGVSDPGWWVSHRHCPAPRQGAAGRSRRLRPRASPGRCAKTPPQSPGRGVHTTLQKGAPGAGWPGTGQPRPAIRRPPPACPRPPLS